MTTTEAKQQLAVDLKAVGRDAKDLLSVAAGRAGEKVTQLRTQLDTALQSTKASATSAAKATDQCIRTHPYQTIGVFFGLGILVGILIARR